MTEGTTAELPSARQLVELVHHYLPANLSDDAPGYDATPEYRRLQAARTAAKETGESRWQAFLERLQHALPQCSVQDWSHLHLDTGWRVRVDLPHTVMVEGEEEFRAVVGLVSFLAPVAATYTSFKRKLPLLSPDQFYRWRDSQLFYEPVPATQEYEEVLLRLLNQELGVRRLPNETLFTPVPDVKYSSFGMGEARLIDCLFTDDLW
jgi:hypothetical protein